jgi:radical SAM protein with 4Fe4S-binding SPASM domain
MDIMNRKTGLMKMEEFEVLVRECARHPEVEEVHLHGFGEPLLDRALPEKVALAKKLGLPKTYIVTTGSLLTEELSRKLIEAGLDKIKFSFYGMKKETYERVHRNLNFERTVGSIEAFFRVRDRLLAPNPQVLFQFNQELCDSVEQELFLAHWTPYMDADRRDVFMGTGLHNWAGGRRYANVKLPEKDRHCSWPFHAVQILWNGNVVPCCFDYEGDASMGNVFGSSIESVWKGERYAAFRGIWKARKSSSVAMCAKCDEPEGTWSPKMLEASSQAVSRRVIDVPKEERRRRRERLQRIGREVRVFTRTMC